uniref:CvpA family protein n=1 Tax=candidate division WOR-3 bacterium TaxID=2052148 RepID=A0A7C4GFQ8_UNCW3
MNPVDPAIVLLVGLAVFAEVRRGLALALVDVGRLVLGLVGGMLAYMLVFSLSHDYLAGLIAFSVGVTGVVAGLAALVRALEFNPGWGRRWIARVGAGVIGLGLGLCISFVILPVLGRLPGSSDAVAQSRLARPFLEAVPKLHHAADVLNLDLPQLSSRPALFEEEGSRTITELGPRVNFMRLDGAMCIECRSAVKFEGYFRTAGVRVSPRFRCPNCGRVSDGCQTFEGFHAMYGVCPQEAVRPGFGLDCGVWSNDRPVLPLGDCPVDRPNGSEE